MDKSVVIVLILVIIAIVITAVVVLFKVQISSSSLLLGGLLLTFTILCFIVYTVSKDRVKDKAEETQKYWAIYEDVRKFWEAAERGEKLIPKKYVSKYFGNQKSAELMHAYIFTVESNSRMGMYLICVTDDASQIRAIQEVEVNLASEDEAELLINPFKVLTVYEGSPVKDFDIGTDLAGSKFAKPKLPNKEDEKKEEEQQSSDRTFGFGGGEEGV